MRALPLLMTALAMAAAPAAAQPSAAAREQPIDDLAADLAFGFCPLFLAGRFSLTGPELAQRGFGKAVVRQPHPRVGELSLVEAKRDDGTIAFGGAVGKACSVVVGVSDRAAVLARLRKNMTFMGLDFQPTANVGPQLPGVKVETFKASVDARILYLQLVQAEAPIPTVAAQLFAMDK